MNKKKNDFDETMTEYFLRQSMQITARILHWFRLTPPKPILPEKKNRFHMNRK